MLLEKVHTLSVSYFAAITNTGPFLNNQYFTLMPYFSLTTLLSSMHYSWLVYAPFFHWCCMSRDHPGILFTSFRMGSDCGAAVRVPGCGSAGHGFNPNSRHSVSHPSFRMVSKWVTWMSHWPLVGLMSSPLPQTQRVNEMEMSTVAKRSHSVCFQLYLYLPQRL